jgi:RNA polymerase sigma factor (sigma-70 family)
VRPQKDVPPLVTEGGFEVFYRVQFARAVQLAWLLTHSRAVSEDLAQEAFVSVQARFTDLDRPEAYLRAALVNRCRSWHRAQRRHRDAQDRLASLPRDCPDPVDEYLRDAIAALSYRQRVVIVARYWGGWTEEEIAAALGCRPGTVKSLASRALARLREEIDR